MVRISPVIRARAVALRKSGKTYGDISDEIGRISKGTLYYWLRNISLSSQSQKKLQERIGQKLLLAQQKGHKILKIRRKKYFLGIEHSLAPLPLLLKERSVALITLATLYLGEGAKTRAGSLSLGNSDPDVIKLFLRLLRFCYTIDETKFRATVQGRADQDFKSLESFWSKITNIPRAKFYEFRVDPRSRGKRTLKSDYKGVCRIDYFSAKIFHELMVLGNLLKTGR